ncbi:molybdenum cofactor sulfurase [Quercus suber]|uniref:Molybdenum cofactor sulfurase n=1 Tax=Quercus suber TaxID=58331 RepID=A0AAW0L3A3_QUESU
MDPEKAEFLKEFGADYGYPTGPKSIDQIRATEFKRLDVHLISFVLASVSVSTSVSAIWSNGGISSTSIGVFADRMTHILSTYLMNPTRIRVGRSESQLPFKDVLKM